MITREVLKYTLSRFSIQEKKQDHNMTWTCHTTTEAYWTVHQLQSTISQQRRTRPWVSREARIRHHACAGPNGRLRQNGPSPATSGSDGPPHQPIDHGPCVPWQLDVSHRGLGSPYSPSRVPLSGARFRGDRAGAAPGTGGGATWDPSSGARGVVSCLRGDRQRRAAQARRGAWALG